MNKQQKNQPPDVIAELKLTDDEVLIIDAIVFRAQFEMKNLHFRCMGGHYKLATDIDIQAIRHVLERVSNFLRTRELTCL